MGEGKPGTSHSSGDHSSHPAQEGHSPQGGVKDTDDLSSIKDVQKTGMQEKARQVENLPDTLGDTGIPKNSTPRS